MKTIGATPDSAYSVVLRSSPKKLAVTRAYDADNHMTSETQSNGYVAGSYVYNADGQRVRRRVGSTETWQVYGMDGELLAEYAANASYTSPQKEYGYRNGQLLITAEPGSGSGGVQNVSWASAVGVSISGNSLTKTGANGWNAGAVSTQSISSGDGYVEFTANANSANTLCGLSHGDTNQSYEDIDFALYPWTDGNLYVWESGSSRGSVGPYTAGDVFRVAVEGGVVKYRKNGTLLYTSALTPNYPLLIDSTIYPQGGSIANAVIGGNFGSGSANINWLVADQLGTPRLVFDKTGSLVGTKRHDYLPFGEDIFAGTGSRTTTQGYQASPNANDGVRQKFTQYERDNETGLDYAQARYYGSIQGRFTSADSVGGSQLNPQSLNLYAYVLNNPLAYTDPTGHMAYPGSYNPVGCLLGGGMGCNGEPMFQRGQDPAQPPPATHAGDDYPASPNGSPMGKIADLMILGGQDPVSTSNEGIITSIPMRPVLPPSAMDYVPVVGTARRFLFNYNTQNFEGALLNFAELSLELGTLNVGASMAATRAFATGSGEAIFFSGKGTFQLAKQAAGIEGGRVITQTFGGKALEKLTLALPERLSTSVWNWGSKHFAEGASGNVRVFLREPLRNYSTWRQVEHPILRVNPFVKITPR
jgi:RHS repeat-associated protein